MPERRSFHLVRYLKLIVKARMTHVLNLLSGEIVKYCIHCQPGPTQEVIVMRSRRSLASGEQSNNEAGGTSIVAGWMVRLASTTIIKPFKWWNHFTTGSACVSMYHSVYHAWHGATRFSGIWCVGNSIVGRALLVGWLLIFLVSCCNVSHSFYFPGRGPRVEQAFNSMNLLRLLLGSQALKVFWLRP